MHFEISYLAAIPYLKAPVIVVWGWLTPSEPQTRGCNSLYISSHSPTNSRPLEVVVVDTSQEEDVWINDELVRLGLAKFSGPVVAVQAELYTGTRYYFILSFSIQ